jgi:heat shock protein HslJ
MKRLLVAAPIVALFAAAPAPAVAQGPYRALGTEPFWDLTIDGRSLTFNTPEPGTRVRVAAPRPRLSRGGRSYWTRRMQVTITRAEPCSDGMSDFMYPDTVRVVVDGTRYEGCGGAVLPPETLAQTNWRIVSIAGTDVSRLDGYELDFENDRMSGRAGCNRFSGPYRVTRDGFQAGALAMTRMACPGAAMRHEQAVSRILGGRLRLTYPDGRTLVMTGPQGTLRLRRN